MRTSPYAPRPRTCRLPLGWLQNCTCLKSMDAKDRSLDPWSDPGTKLGCTTCRAQGAPGLEGAEGVSVRAARYSTLARQ